MKATPRKSQWMLFVAILISAVVSRAEQTYTAAGTPVPHSGVSGGLCVQVGGQHASIAAELAKTGRFVVQLLDTNPETVERLRNVFHASRLYGLASADQLASPASLPYTENLINLLIIENRSDLSVPPAEIARVLCPGGVVLVAGRKLSEAALRTAGLADVREVHAGGTWITGRKPWPPELDDWTHPRHAADGNAVSRDRLVAPPRRVRWVTGPPRENSQMVSCDGRNFYAGALARDSFNGLRLWQRPVQSGGPFAVPVASGNLLFAVTNKKLVALDAATGSTVREFGEAGTPHRILCLDGLLVVTDHESIRALEAESGRLCWKLQATEPRCVVAGDGDVFFLHGLPRRGEKCVAASLDLASGNVQWETADYPWAPKVTGAVYHRGLLAYEISTLSNDEPGNSIHVISAADGEPMWDYTFVPGMNHKKQARAMFVGDALWVLEHRKCVALEPQTGERMREYDAGFCHCFPPVATPRYLFAGEMELTDLRTGRLDANRISKAACGRDAGWVPANGLIYVFPKHCVCWPMLRGYAALAPALPQSDGAKRLQDLAFPLERGVRPPTRYSAEVDDQWPCYRKDPWRSGSTSAQVPAELRTLWTTPLGGWPDGLVAEDWRENPFVHGPVTSPVAADGLVFVARPDAHQIVALDWRTGTIQWRYTANGRVDTPPTIHRGLCLFGTKSGWVYCLRADDGRLVWRLRAAPTEQRIVAYGQIESPWPVPGSVLVVDGAAFFAAGRQSLADGGILVFAVEPASGNIHWVRRLDTVPTTDFYGCAALEFDNFDLLHREGDRVAMSRWLFDRATGQMTVKAAEAFVRLATAGSGAVVPRGCWSYAPRHQPRAGKTRPPMRPLAVFREDTLLGCLQDQRTVYRRDFDLHTVEQFDRTWITGWTASANFREGSGEVWRSQRLSQGAKWKVSVFPESAAGQTIAAMVLAGGTAFVAGSQGGLTAISAADGEVLARAELPAPVWDGMAAAGGRLFVSTKDGQVTCLGKQ